MAKLYEYVLGRGTRCPEISDLDAAVRAHPENGPMYYFLSKARRAQHAVFDVTNILPAVDAGPSIEGLSCKPPFNVSWFELPYRSCGPRCLIGCVVEYTNRANNEPRLWLTTMFHHANGCSKESKWQEAVGPEQPLPPAINEFVPMIGDLPLDPGTFIPRFSESKGIVFGAALTMPQLAALPQKEQEGILWRLLALGVVPSLFAIELLNCKNVAMTTHEPPAKLQKARLRRGKPPLVTYKTLEINVPRSRAAHESAGGGVGVAQHIQRGHFKNFDEKPLFGKVKGSFWWSGHVRGDTDFGVVSKTYSVSADRENE